MNPHRFRRADSHPAHRRSQITHAFNLDTTLGRFAPEVSLAEFDAEGADHGQLAGGLDAFGHDLATDGTGDADVAAEMLDVRWLGVDADDAALVDFENVGLEENQALEATAAEADVVDGDEDAGFAQCPHCRN